MKNTICTILVTFVWALTSSCSSKDVSRENNITMPTETNISNPITDVKLDTATFGAGCFWCVEAVFQNLKGVYAVASGYEGGKISNPTYREVCSGRTGHAEVIQIQYNPAEISFKELLEIFWQTHDPTTLNRQGNDEGTQYRSVIFYHSDEQKSLAEQYKKALNDENVFGKPVVTEVSPAATFYKAEDYHQNYFNENGDEPYCTYVIKPKVEKMKKVFGDKLKK